MILLCQEIPEKTEFEAKPVPWADGYSEPTIRIFFESNPTSRNTPFEPFNHSFGNGA
jgi:hypothetical protein